MSCNCTAHRCTSFFGKFSLALLSNLLCIEMFANCLPVDQTDNTTSSPTSESSQPREHGQKFDVFLSHSGKQKNFVRQLHRDLTQQGVSCFFDEDRESLPVGENFPSRILEAAKACKVAVLLLSKDFLKSKWPMIELSAFVKARDTTNPKLIILPLFFLISPDYLKNITEDNKKWRQLKMSEKERAEWHQALKAIRPITGLLFAEGGNEVQFRDKIVREICKILPRPSPGYQGNFFSIQAPGEQKIMLIVDLGCRNHTTMFIKLVKAKEGVDSADDNGDCTVTIIGAVNPAFPIGIVMKFGPLDTAILVDPDFFIGKKLLKVGAAHLLECGAQDKSF
ncbi:uncharacterized protein LOC131060353 [Cryptomeria japonica]|uniref:uncharacterized protein LOC131060353 n=1 Tax=Cryptomeria japonica TaxID=3369 RepID=UPI0027DA39C5|nr:uncharacterized protein LOC131060353 [Cryptomeria japonica]